jgi:DNA-binding NarL/FixJ family response regulator
LRQFEIASFDENTPRQVIIGVSANSDYDAALAAFDHGINAFIPKPFSLDTFNRALQSVLKIAKDETISSQIDSAKSFRRRNNFLENY